MCNIFFPVCVSVCCLIAFTYKHKAASHLDFTVVFWTLHLMTSSQDLLMLLVIQVEKLSWWDKWQFGVMASALNSTGSFEGLHLNLIWLLSLLWVVTFPFLPNSDFSFLSYWLCELMTSLRVFIMSTTHRPTRKLGALLGIWCGKWYTESLFESLMFLTWI